MDCNYSGAFAPQMSCLRKRLVRDWSVAPTLDNPFSACVVIHTGSWEQGDL